MINYDESQVRTNTKFNSIMSEKGDLTLKCDIVENEKDSRQVTILFATGGGGEIYDPMIKRTGSEKMVQNLQIIYVVYIRKTANNSCFQCS